MFRTLYHYWIKWRIDRLERQDMAVWLWPSADASLADIPSGVKYRPATGNEPPPTTAEMLETRLRWIYDDISRVGRWQELPPQLISREYLERLKSTGRKSRELHDLFVKQQAESRRGRAIPNDPTFQSPEDRAAMAEMDYVQNSGLYD